MNSRLKETFDMIHADENLKSSTKNTLFAKQRIITDTDSF